MRESRQVGWLGHLCLLCFVSGYRGEVEVIARSEYARPSLAIVLSSRDLLLQMKILIRISNKD